MKKITYKEFIAEIEKPLKSRISILETDLSNAKSRISILETDLSNAKRAFNRLLSDNQSLMHDLNKSRG